VTINGGLVNAILVGGYLGGTDQDDWFKITSLTGESRNHSVPEPSALLIMLSGTAMAIPGLRRQLGRKF
jgi:hypothetical protein